MAGDWIKMRTNLWDDPRVSKMVDMTDTSEAQVIGALYWLWAMADQHSAEGFLPSLSFKQINRKVGVKGFGEALEAIGWGAELQDGVLIINFDDHNGASAKKRCQTARRVANHQAANAHEPKDGDSANAACVSTALAREEKRREEVNLSSSLRSEGADRADEKSTAPPATDGSGDDSLLSAIYAVGRPLMLSGGCSGRSAGSLLGKLRKELGDLDALVTVEAMAREKPLDAAAWVAAAIKARQSKAVGLDAFMSGCRARGESVVSGYAPVFEYAEQAGIPDEFIRLAWDEFKRRHMPGGIWEQTKREDWRQSFLAALQTNALRLWYFDAKSQGFLLTTVGMQAELSTRSAA